jgi:FdhD protein
MQSKDIWRYEQQSWSETPDLLAVEEPMEIRLGYGDASDRQQSSLAVTMRTPGHDLELTLGFLYAEGIISSPDQVLSIKHCSDKDVEAEARKNIVRAELAPEVKLDWEKLQRNFFTSSSCGICGKASIESVQMGSCPTLPLAKAWLSADTILACPQALHESQTSFRYTGGLHAAALFDKDGKLILLKEDIGRHNAMDKLIGAALYQGLFPLHDYICQLSGRLSFELVQKSLIAGIPVLLAIGAPSTLAVELSREFGQTLIGFVKKDRFNIYTGIERIIIHEQHPL